MKIPYRRFSREQELAAANQRRLREQQLAAASERLDTLIAPFLVDGVQRDENGLVTYRGVEIMRVFVGGNAIDFFAVIWANDFSVHKITFGLFPHKFGYILRNEISKIQSSGSD